jgi:hypothetical protein
MAILSSVTTGEPIAWARPTAAAGPPARKSGPIVDAAMSRMKDRPAGAISTD